MPEIEVPVPNSDPKVQTSSESQSSAEAKKLKEYEDRLAGAISAMDKARAETNELKKNLQQKETDFANQLQLKEVEYKSDLIKREKDLTDLISVKTSLERDHEKVKMERDKTSAELARWNLIAENPSLLPYKDVLPATTDVEALKRAADAITKARQLDRQALADQVRGGQQLPVPQANQTRDSLYAAMQKAVGTAKFDEALKAYQDFDKAEKK